MVLGGVDRDSIEPSVESAIAAERRRCTIRFQKRFLRNVEGFGRVTNVSHDELDDLVLVLDDQQIERRSVALLHASDQREVCGSATGRVSVGLLCQTLLGRPHAPPKVRPAPQGLQRREAAHGSWNDSSSDRFRATACKRDPRRSPAARSGEKRAQPPPLARPEPDRRPAIGRVAMDPFQGRA